MTGGPIESRETLLAVVCRSLALLVLLALAGCASGANSSNRTAAVQPHLAAKPGASLYQSVGIAAVAGGQDTNPLLMSQVSDGDFKAALKNSLLQSQLHVVGPEKYVVSAEMQGLDQPFMGLDMSVTSKVRYRLTRVSDKAVVLDKVVTATHTAAVGDNPLGVERLRLANEGAIRKNITCFIEEIGKLRV
jgi:hypothetical protein